MRKVIIADMLHGQYVDELVQERHNSSALAMELRLSCTNPPMCWTHLEFKQCTAHIQMYVVYIFSVC